VGSITSVPLRRSRFETSVPEDAVLELVQAINQLVTQLWRFDELPEPLLAIYQADFYVAQVRNGGHSQFLHNARNLERVAALARAGLSMVGAIEELATLDAALALHHRRPSLLDRLRRAGYWSAAKEVSPVFRELDRRIWDLAKSDEGWAHKCAAWLSSSPIVQLVHDEAAFRDAMQRCEAAVPDRVDRQAARDAAREAAMSPFEREVREACRQRGIEYRALRVGRPLDDGTARWKFLTVPEGNHFAIQRGGALVRIEWDVPYTERELALRAMMEDLPSKARE
jgi:hypothetical protein